MLARMVVHMVYCMEEMFRYSGIYYAQAFNFDLNSFVLLQKSTPIRFQTIVMVWSSGYFSSSSNELSGICFFKSYQNVRRVQAISEAG